MPRRIVVFVVLAVSAAALFVRLGLWQLHRREERRARNALVSARLTSAPIDVTALPRDTVDSRYRRVRVAGSLDYEHEVAWTARTHEGAPGVDLITPVRIAGHDTAVLVNRGWVYAPDGATVDFAKWREPDSIFTGYVEELAPGANGESVRHPRAVTRLSAATVAHAFPYPVMPFYVVAVGDAPPAADKPARLDIPALDDGPHLSYAIQWFSFAVIALVGAGVVVARRHDQGRGAEDA